MKTISIISIVYGTLGIIWGTLSMAAIGIQKAILGNFPFPQEALEIVNIPAMLDVLHGIISFLMPFVLIIGAIYIVSGILGLTEKSPAIIFGIAAAAFNIVWYVAYIVMLQMELLPLFNFEQFFPQKIFNMIFTLGTVINAVFYCGYPVFLIIFLSRQRMRTH